MDRITSTPRAVLFDADGVLQRTPPGWLDDIKQLCGNPADASAFVQAVFDAERPCLVGQGDFSQALATVLKQWHSASSLQSALNVWTQIQPDTAVLEQVRSLRDAGTIVALATNQQRYRADYMLHQLGYADVFDHVLFSCDLGHAKPSPTYFERAIEILGFPASDLLFIDDHEQNVLAARAVGLQAQRFHLDDGVQVLTSILRSHGLP